MNRTIFALIIATALIAGPLFSVCQSALPTMDVAVAPGKMPDAKHELKDVRKDETAQEWEAFKLESAEKIRFNEINIADFKDQMSISQSNYDTICSEKIDKLEQKNKELKTRIERYIIRKNTWGSFRNEFNHVIGELRRSLKDLTVDNK